jgi:23S rRNA pseudouridine2457 synthase
MPSEDLLDHQHFALYKPYGVLSQFGSNAKHEQKKQFLGDFYDFPEGTMPIGRLDEDSEGLLLLTTDGKVSDTICKGLYDKEYYAQVDGLITDDAIEQLQKSVEIGFKGIKYNTLPCKVKRLETVPIFPERKRKIRDARHGPTSWISIILHEGKFRQVRKMTSAIVYPTLRLIRVRIGPIHLEHLQPGEVIELKSL